MTTTTTENHTDTAGAEEDTVVVPRPALPQHPQGYAPYGAPGYGPQYGAAYGPQPQTPLSAGFAAGFPAPAPAPAPRRGLAAVSRTTWIAVAAALTLIVVMVAVIVAGSGAGGSAQKVTAGGSSTAAAAPADNGGRVLSAPALQPLLLTPAEIAAAVGLPGSERDVKAGPVTAVPFVDTLESNRECLPVAYPANRDSFQGTGFTAMRAQASGVRVPNADARSWFFSHGVFAYPSADAAEKALQKNVAALTACEGRSWSEASQDANGGAPVFWNAGTVNTDGNGLVTMLNRQENANGWGCWRGLKTEGTVVMDFSVCALDKPESVPAALADAIAKKIPTI